MTKKGGWFNESQRHALAAKGIETGTKSSVSKPSYSGQKRTVRYGTEEGERVFKELIEEALAMGMGVTFDISKDGKKAELHMEQSGDTSGKYRSALYPTLSGNYPEEWVNDLQRKELIDFYQAPDTTVWRVMENLDLIKQRGYNISVSTSR